MPQPGRPTRINEVIATRTVHTDTGDTTENITVADRIIEELRAGGYMEGACAMAGIHKSVVYGWLQIGARVNAELIAGTRTRRTLKAHEVRCLEFSDAVDEAKAWSRAEDERTLHGLAQGGHTTQVVTEKVLVADDGEKIVERTTRTETHPPSAQVLEWRLERRFPGEYGRRTVELSGPDGGPIPLSLEQAATSRLLELVDRMDAQEAPALGDGDAAATG